MRARVRQLLAGLLLWLAVCWFAMEKSPARDCYPLATWDGKHFVPTGEWRCL